MSWREKKVHQTIKLLFFALLFVGCAGTVQTTPLKTSKSSELRLKREITDPKRTQFYGQAFPQGTSFIEKKIPERMLAPWDKDNSLYIEARLNNKTIGFVRDFSGPVSPKQECACNPFTVTLVFDENYKYQDLLLSKPLEKYGHVPFTAEDEARLRDILKAPPKELEKFRIVEHVVDASSGATKAAYADKVVPQAGLVSVRLLHLIKATERVLQGAPVARDQAMLSELLNEKQSSQDLIKSLVQFFPKAETLRVQKQVYRLIAHHYFKDFSESIKSVEDFLLTSPLQDDSQEHELFDVCYRFAQSNKNLPWVASCMQKVSAGKTVDDINKNRLKGMFYAQSKDFKKAYRHLQRVMKSIYAAVDPQLYVQYILAAKANRRNRDSCRAAQELYAAAPLFTGAYEMLDACGDKKRIEKIAESIKEIQKKMLLDSEKKSAEPVPEINVQDDNFNDLSLSLVGKHTVLLFFATWCPHCRTEFPRIKAFQEILDRNVALQNKVQIIGVRTAVEREKQSFESFVREFRPNFKIYADATMSMAFSKFARTQGIGGGLPTLVVIDDRGYLRWLMPTGTYRNTTEELEWVVDKLLGRSKR
ncbi:MAG: hypothetical protein CMH60_01465 [Myxococcales bacterium]|nr:hypothetical protein [Myxococcales bacterium]